jgi:1,4-dihydroxy-2-naphthoate octaprenyltransferase
MSVKSFLKLVEIQTKVASIIPFLLGTMFVLFYYDSFNLINFLYMLVSLLCIDMCTTTINNYLDYKKANKKEGYGHNAIVRDNIKESSVLIVIFLLLTIAIVFGILLYLNTNIVVLIIGAISFMIGILYTFGPVPISRTPFGEILSGGTMGLVITFLAIYIHIYQENVIDISIINGLLKLEINYPTVLSILLIALPATFGIANIMLANNICDIEDDIVNKRYTLPIYIGKKVALVLYKVNYYLGYLAIIVAIILGLLPVISILALLTFFIVQKHINIFSEKQSKKETFVLTIKNFIILNSALVLTIGLEIIIDSLFK